jgi:hippurate hydrolase
VINDPALAAGSAALLATALGKDRVMLAPPARRAAMPARLFRICGSRRQQIGVLRRGRHRSRLIEAAKAGGKPVPVNHSPFFAPVPDPQSAPAWKC